MRVLAFGTTSNGEGYPRMDVLLEGLKRNGAQVERLIQPLFKNPAEKLRLASGNITAALNLAPRLLKTYSDLGQAFRLARSPDVVLVGGLGHLDLLWLRCLPGGDRIPVVFDPFLSLHDTLAGDRKLVPPDSFRARACLALDRQACMKADRILVDTDAMAKRFIREYDLPAGRIRRLYQGQDDEIFRPKEDEVPGSSAGAPTEVLFIGTYVPLQGVETILGAAAVLRQETVRFTLVGDGQAREEASRLARRLKLENVHFERAWQSGPALARRMHEADICLGIFGTSTKAASVIPLKAVAALAMGRPLITRDSPAAREVLIHEQNAWLVPPGDGEALADAVRFLSRRRDLRETLGERGRRLFLDRMSPDALGRELMAILEDLVEERTRTLATV